MYGPMPSFASGRTFWTAWASTCAAECRMTLRPSSVSAPTASTSTSDSGAQARSRSRPPASRTTTTALGPLVGRPASRTAAPAVVPAGTRTGADAVRGAGADTRCLQEGRCGIRRITAGTHPMLVPGLDVISGSAPGCSVHRPRDRGPGCPGGFCRPRGRERGRRSRRPGCGSARRDRRRHRRRAVGQGGAEHGGRSLLTRHAPSGRRRREQADRRVALHPRPAGCGARLRSAGCRDTHRKRLPRTR